METELVTDNNNDNNKQQCYSNIVTQWLGSNISIDYITQYDVPLCYNTLLCHSNLMTPTLERHHQSPIHLNIHSINYDKTNNILSRSITLYAKPTAITTTKLPFHSPVQCPYKQHNSDTSTTTTTTSNTQGMCDCFSTCSCFGYNGVVELGYIHIYLNNIHNNILNNDIIKGEIPFGALLKQYNINVYSQLQSFIKLNNVNYNDNDILQYLKPNNTLAYTSHSRALQQQQQQCNNNSNNNSTIVYGRINRLYNKDYNSIIADVVELIPPIHQYLNFA